MYNRRGSRALRRRPPTFAREKQQQQQKQKQNVCERKMRSLQSLQERFCFTLKRPRTSRARPCKGGPNSAQAPSPNSGGKFSIMENGLIQIPHLHCDYYYERLSTTSSYPQVSSSSASTSSVSSSITDQAGLVYSPISTSENSSDEVMSLVGCSDLIKENVLDFMPSTMEGNGSKSCPDMCEKKVNSGEEALCMKGWVDMCDANLGSSSKKEESSSSSSVEDDGEPYRIDLCDFEPDVSAISSCSNEQQEDGAPHHHEKKNGGGVLCLSLDYDEVLRAWKEKGEFFIAKAPSNYPSPYLDPFHTFSHTPFVPHPPYF